MLFTIDSWINFSYNIYVVLIFGLYFESNYLFFHHCYLNKTRDVASLLEPTSDFRSKEMLRGRTSKLAQSFTSTRVAILPLPVSHTRPPLNSLPTHSFPLFCLLRRHLTWETTEAVFLKVPAWQGDRGHYSAFSLIWKHQVKLKRGSSAPSLKTLSTPASLPSTSPRHPHLSLGGLSQSVLRPPLSVWYQCYCERLTKNRKPEGRQGRPEGQLNQSLYDGCSVGARSPEMHQTRWCNVCPLWSFFSFYSFSHTQSYTHKRHIII